MAKNGVKNADSVQLGCEDICAFVDEAHGHEQEELEAAKAAEGANKAKLAAVARSSSFMILVLMFMTASLVRGCFWGLLTLGRRSRCAEALAKTILAEPKVQQLREKIEARYPITLDEFRECLDQISDVDRFIGWVLKDGAKSALEPLFRGKKPIVGSKTTPIKPAKNSVRENNHIRKDKPETATIQNAGTGSVSSQTPGVIPATVGATSNASDPVYEQDIIGGVLNQLSWKISSDKGICSAKAEIVTRNISRLNQNIKGGVGMGVATRPLSSKGHYEISFPQTAFPVLQAKGVGLIERPNPKFG